MKQSMKLGARILENLPVMSPDIMQGWIDNPTALRDFLAGLVPSEMIANPVVPCKQQNSYLKRVATVTLGATSGSATLAQAGDVFTGHVDPDFQNWGTNVSGTDTEEVAADIYEMKQDGKYTQLFGSLVGTQGSYDEIALACRPLCWQQGQIKEFCRTNRHLLRQDGYATLFLFEVNGEVFVAYVDVDGGRLGARVVRFSDDFVWHAVNRSRVVVP